MHTSVLQLIRGKRPVALLFSCVFITLLNSQITFAITTNVSLSEKGQRILKDAQQQIVDKKYQRALELSTEVLDENHQQYEAQFIQAEALSHLGKMDESVKLYTHILKANPRLPEVYNNLANLYARQGNLDLARKTLEQGIATNKQYQTLYENLSAIYVEMARGAYSKALKLGVHAKAVQLKTLTMALVEQASLAQASQNQTTETLLLPPAIAVKPALHSVEQNAVVIANADTLNSKKINSTKIDTVEKKIQLPMKVAVNVDQKESNVSKPAFSPIVKSKPVSKSEIKIHKDEVITALQGWAAAWSAQAVDLYLSFYGEEFKPNKLSKKVWAVQRRIRIKKPGWVNVQLADFDVQLKSEQTDFAVVQLVQNYSAENYHDKTRKQFEMKRTMDGWRILSEQSLAVIK